MLVPYECCSQDFVDYYAGQAGNGLAYYTGQSHQRGYGIGAWFKNLFRSALPFLFKGAKAVGKEALRTGAMIANDVIEGKQFKEAAEERSKEAGKKLAKKAIRKTDEMLGEGGGKPYKRKRKAKKFIISKRARKEKGRDIFDPE